MAPNFKNLDEFGREKDNRRIRREAERKKKDRYNKKHVTDMEDLIYERDMQ